jgi:phage-related protein
VAGTQAIFYRDGHGVEPVARFIETLPAKHRAKVYALIEEHLNGQPADAPPPEHPVTSQIQGELRELRVRFGNTRYRILYQRSENLLVFLSAFEKNTGAVPRSQIETAVRRMADFKSRMNARRRRPPRAVGRDVPPRRLKP